MKNKVLSFKKAQSLDKKLIYKIGIPRIVLMENAGRNVAEFVISKSKLSQKVGIFCGLGYNGGDGLAAARHLYIAQRTISVFIVGSKYKAKDETTLERRILENMGVRIKEIKTYMDIHRLKNKIKQFDFLVDALLGTGLQGEIRPLFYYLIEYINSLSKIIKVSLDVPSGLNAESGYPQGIAIKADYTITFQGIKKGFLTPEGKKYTGEVITTKIGG